MNLTQGTEKVSFFITSNRKEPLTTFRINNLNLNTLKRNQDFTWSFKSRERLNARSAKGVPWFLSYFKTLNTGPAPGIEPATTRSAVNRSTDWANPAVVLTFFLKAAVLNTVFFLAFSPRQEDLPLY